MEAGDDAPVDRSLAALANSARGWHGVQLAVLALAASSSWWPTPERAGLDDIGATVRITDQAGRTACGTIVDGADETIRLATADGPVELALSALADIVPVDSC